MIKHIELNFKYDKQRVIEEIFNHSSMFVHIPPAKMPLRFRTFDLVDPSLYQKITTVGINGIEWGKITTWRGLSFTHIPGNKSSEYGSNSLRELDVNWEWRPNIHCIYIQDIVQRLGFTKVQTVRAMTINPPGFGPVHCDLVPNSKYYQDHISVTLNLENGGQPLVAMVENKLVEIDNDCFVFYDDCWHGVDLVKSRRTQVRINGIVDKNILNQYISDEALHIR